MRRIIAYLLAVAVGFVACTSPARAFAPVAVIGPPVIQSVGGGSYALGALAGLVGLVGGYLELEDALGGDDVRIPLSDNPSGQPPAPEPPAMSDPRFTYDGYADKQTACTAYFTAAYSGTIPNDPNCGSSSTYSFQITGYGDSSCTANTRKTCEGGYQFPAYPVTHNMVKATVCPSGFTLQSATCVLQNPAQTKPREDFEDGKRDLGSTGGVMSPLPDRDNGPGGYPPAGTSGAVMTPLIRNDGRLAQVTGTDPQGRPALLEVERTPENDRTLVRYYVQDVIGDQTVVNKKEVTIDTATQTVTSVSSVTMPGTITQPATAEVPTTAPTATAQNSPQVVTTGPQVAPQEKVQVTVNTCGIPGQPACAVDDSSFGDKAAQVDAAKASTQTELTGIPDKLKEKAEKAHELDTEWFPSLLPGSPTACRPIPFEANINHGWLSGFASSHQLDLCPYFDIVRQLLGYLLGVFTIWYIWRAFAGSQKGAD